jgi:hypothetical protein
MKKQMIKRLTGVMVLIFVLQPTKFNVQASNISCLENEKISCTDDIPNLVNDNESQSALCEKLWNDYNINTTNLSPEVERELNAVGVTDAAINELDNETISEIENSINTKVTISYFEVDEQTGDMKEMNNEEIDQFFKLQSDEGKNIEDENKISTYVYNEDKESKTNTTGVLQQTIYACQQSKGGKVSVTATASWLKEATYKGIDVFGVTTSNVQMDTSSYSCTHKANYVHKDALTGKLESTAKKTNPTSFCDIGPGIAYNVNLFGTAKTENDQYCQETIIVKFSCKLFDEKVKKMEFTSHYFHAKTNKEFTPSIAIGTGGISVSVSGNSSISYTEMDRNPKLYFTFK